MKQDLTLDGVIKPARKPPQLSAVAVMSLLTLLVAAVCVQLGALPISPNDWLLPPWVHSDAVSGSAHVLWQLRLPRLVLSMMVGAALALAGALAQALFRNPMADPGLLGVSSGAGAAVALSLTVFATVQYVLPPALRMWMLPMIGFLGALSVCFALERMARWLAPGSIAGLLLTGLALQAICFALIGLCSNLANDEQLRALNFWTLGSLAGANWIMAGVMLAALAFGASGALRMAQRLNALALGEAAASHVGIDVQKLRTRSIALVALLSALAVAWCGSIGFIGLMAPHLARQLVGADQRRLIPVAMVSGALLLMIADTLARTVASPAEVPVGVFSALIGAPWFLYLLRGAMRRTGSA